MVLKPIDPAILESVSFESDVISDGTQTGSYQFFIPDGFESDVISDGTQTNHAVPRLKNLFESDVISDGTQTHSPLSVM